ncbi:hypothetical protein G6F40_015931 [Rhizopus arrhizus]|nr:hypothetical protein G6F40_015931 [Rhizopus arrhizus]
MPNAIQCSQSATNFAAPEPSPQPITGVIASITPKITPVRRASGRRGLCRAAPLLMAAANASVDMANARTMRERAFMERGVQLGENGTDPSHRPASCEKSVVSPSAMPLTPWPARAKNVDVSPFRTG